MTATSPPSTSSRTAAIVLATGCALGIAADLLFKGAGVGINVVIWVLLVATAATFIARRYFTAGLFPDRWLLTAIGFAFCLAIRDAEYLRVFNVLAMVIALALTGMSLRVAAHRGRLRDYAETAARTASIAAAGAILLSTEANAFRALNGGATRRTGPLLAGLALSIPIVVVFGALFGSADPMFAGFIRALTDWNLAPVFEHIAIALGFGCLAAGLLRAWLWKPKPLPRIIEAPSVSPITVGIATGAMSLMFLLFIASQSRYLFGGAAFIEAVPGLTYAEHARRGFFEMVAASALAVPVLYTADVLLAGASARAVQNVRALGSLQLMLIGIVMFSALHRVGLYIKAYGLTEDRLVGVAILVWLGASIVWFAITVLRGRSERFTFGSVVSGFTVLALLNAVNPDALIARINTAREAQGRELDRAHLATLSADAVPVLARWVAAMPADMRCEPLARMRKQWTENETDWRSWNRAISRARHETNELLARAPCAAGTVTTN